MVVNQKHTRRIKLKIKIHSWIECILRNLEMVKNRDEIEARPLEIPFNLLICIHPYQKSNKHVK